MHQIRYTGFARASNTINGPYFSFAKATLNDACSSDKLTLFAFWCRFTANNVDSSHGLCLPIFVYTPSENLVRAFLHRLFEGMVPEMGHEVIHVQTFGIEELCVQAIFFKDIRNVSGLEYFFWDRISHICVTLSCLHHKQCVNGVNIRNIF